VGGTPNGFCRDAEGEGGLIRLPGAQRNGKSRSTRGQSLDGYHGGRRRGRGRSTRDVKGKPAGGSFERGINLPLISQTVYRKGTKSERTKDYQQGNRNQLCGERSDGRVKTALRLSHNSLGGGRRRRGQDRERRATGKAVKKGTSESRDAQ